jgi:hypothetical protein
MKTLRLTTFIAFTLLWSYFFLIEKPLAGLQNEVPFLIYLLVGLLPAVGLFLMGRTFREQLKSTITTSLLGENKKLSLIVAALPVICLTFFGVPNAMDIQSNFFGLYLSLMLMSYALLSEYGWRGYLQEELNFKNKWVNYTIIGMVWYASLWFFLYEGMVNNILNVLLLTSLVFISGAIGEMVKRTNSLLIGAAFHTLGYMVYFYSLTANNLTANAKLAIPIICIAGWVILFKKSEKVESEFIEVNA